MSKRTLDGVYEAIERAASNSDARLDDVDMTIRRNGDALNRTRDNMNQRIDSILRSLGALGAKLDKIAADDEILEARRDVTNQRFDGLAATLSDHFQGYDKLAGEEGRAAGRSDIENAIHLLRERKSRIYDLERSIELGTPTERELLKRAEKAEAEATRMNEIYLDERKEWRSIESMNLEAQRAEKAEAELAKMGFPSGWTDLED